MWCLTTIDVNQKDKTPKNQGNCGSCSFFKDRVATKTTKKINKDKDDDDEKEKDDELNLGYSNLKKYVDNGLHLPPSRVPA